jgi:hypothetical protein
VTTTACCGTGAGRLRRSGRSAPTVTQSDRYRKQWICSGWQIMHFTFFIVKNVMFEHTMKTERRDHSSYMHVTCKHT